MERKTKNIIIITIFMFICGCTSKYSHFNVEMDHDLRNHDTMATFSVNGDRGNKDALFLLALSGGGSRAAYFSASVMLRLEDVLPENLLEQVDVISSVSGGSLAGAYYCISNSASPSSTSPERLWDEKKVKEYVTIQHKKNEKVLDRVFLRIHQN